MKTLIYAALVANALAVPAVSFAQDSTAPLTRAEVRADLVQMEQAGYRPSLKDPHYPTDVQAAEARIHAQDATTSSSMAVGGVSMNGSSQSGAPSASAGTHSIYFGH
ncbi:DUF4148 domain-containing protein [Paraburkholderia sprentiae WSM5005]|uniref:DUF4148 domain-containing protein n=1 Tax=Paraburkholderia sprentiae WSM5005 TaxID=754502 RepID=A0A1I9YR32_9BURK|nr:DUF4148 domain-containing protein [Paraburkholderia sprentiae]APA88656.1 DUF4148 domain-containing protein [Paraburkholderia sprentiae WSM5005]